ncbi:MAG: methylthioribulose 1-phosphate dehydratase [Gammaproteobacteria bacterium]|nr:methylthioribulose 1-phosphate dehydratase [Gammaproteobacteria bacterium]
MTQKLNSLSPCEGLTCAARDFHQRGWMAGTAGNMSVRVDENSFWLTASGKPKGSLDQKDFVKVSLNGDLIEEVAVGNKPSAESSIHQVVYRLFPDAGACLHVHSVDAYIATRRFCTENLQMMLPDIEMIKGFDVWEQNPGILLDVFENHRDVKKIAADIEARYRQTSPRITALMIRDHGVTVWAPDLQTAYNRVEILEFIMSFMARSA